MVKSKRNSNTLIEFLKVLTQIFDEWDDAMKTLLAQSRKDAKRLKEFESLDFTDPKLIEDLTKKFSPERLSILLQVLFQLSEYETKFRSVAKERKQELDDMRKLIKDTKTNLYKLLDDKN